MNGLVAQIVTAVLSGGIGGGVAMWVAHQNRKSAVEVTAAETEVKEAEVVLKRDEFALNAMESSLRQVVADNAALARKVTNLTQKVDALETRIESERQRFTVLLRYTQRLRDWIAQHVPGIDPPQPPRELEGVI